MSNSLSDKIRLINEKIPITKVLPLVGIHAETSHQVNCPFHDDDNASAKVFIHDRDNYKANGLYCWVCGNFTTFDIVKKHTGSVKEALDYFESLGLDLNFGRGSKEHGDSFHKKLSEELMEYRKNMYRVSWGKKDIYLLQKYIHVYGDNSKRVRRALYKVLLQRKLKQGQVRK